MKKKYKKKISLLYFGLIFNSYLSSSPARAVENFQDIEKIVLDFAKQKAQEAGNLQFHWVDLFNTDHDVSDHQKEFQALRKKNDLVSITPIQPFFFKDKAEYIAEKAKWPFLPLENNSSTVSEFQCIIDPEASDGLTYTLTLDSGFQVPSLRPVRVVKINVPFSDPNKKIEKFIIPSLTLTSQKNSLNSYKKQTLVDKEESTVLSVKLPPASTKLLTKYYSSYLIPFTYEVRLSGFVISHFGKANPQFATYPIAQILENYPGFERVDDNNINFKIRGQFLHNFSRYDIL